jgi:nitrate reductase gamma subunit
MEMLELYDFLAGPGVWIAFAVFIGGLIIRLTYLLGLSKCRDKVVYDHFSFGWGVKSIWHWLIPLGSVSLRAQPLFGVAVWIFHICLFGAALLFSGHNMLLKESLGWSFISVSDGVADVLTILVLICAAFMLLRRIIKPEVRILTTAWDYFLILLTAAPFLTGFLAKYQAGPYEFMLTLHILVSEVLLIVIPFSKLGHMVLFFATRFVIGSEMGGRRNIEDREGARVW